MKKSIVTIMILLVLVLSACGGSQSAAVTEPAAEVTEAAEVAETEVAAAEAYPAATEAVVEAVATTGGLNADYENAVSVEMQLVLGTLKLSGTDQAITAEQANALLPLWSDYQTALQSAMPNMGEPGQSPQPGQDESGTPAAVVGAPQAMPTVDPAVQTQLDDLMAQIESAMTAEQITAIADMKITSETAMTIMQEQMATMGAAQGDANGGNQPPQGGQGQMPQGTPGAGGAGQMGGAQSSAQGGQGMGAGMVQPQLVQAVISALQTIAGVESSSS